MASAKNPLEQPDTHWPSSSQWLDTLQAEQFVALLVHVKHSSEHPAIQHKLKTSCIQPTATVNTGFTSWTTLSWNLLTDHSLRSHEHSYNFNPWLTTRKSNLPWGISCSLFHNKKLGHSHNDIRYTNQVSTADHLYKFLPYIDKSLQKKDGLVHYSSASPG